MAARLNGIARGGSGASVAAAEVLVALLNHGVHPQVPSTGSVGAADLGQLASIALVAVGQGQAVYRGEVLPGAEALTRAGIEPLVPSGKDGLALISSNALSIGEAALLVARAHHVAQMADLATALSMEAVGANPSILHPAVAAATGFAGQQQVADHLRELLAGSRLFEPGGVRSVQDALSFRVVPQVHGAFRHYLAGLEQAVSQELNAAADNPLASVAEQTMISNGNFHPMVLAIATDALRIALTHVGQLSERRMAHLWDGFFAGPGPEPVGRPLGQSLRYPAAAVFAELKHLAAPATLDTPTLDLGVEDHASGAPLSVRLTDRSLDLVHDLLAIETLLARDLLTRTADPPPLGQRTGALLADLDDVAAPRSAPRRRTFIARCGSDWRVQPWMTEFRGSIVFQPPAELPDAEVLDLVRLGWSPTVDRVEHLAIGFGAHHWRAEEGGVPLFFVTYDRFGDRHTATSLAAAYAGAVELAERGLEFVLAPARARSGAVVLPVADGALSCTPWVTADVIGYGSDLDAATAAQNIADLARLHTSTPPEQIPRWQPVVPPDFVGRLQQPGR